MKKQLVINNEVILNLCKNTHFGKQQQHHQHHQLVISSDKLGRFSSIQTKNLEPMESMRNQWFEKKDELHFT